MAEDCLAVRVRLLSRRLSRIYDSALRPLGLTVAQLNVLSVIDVVDSAPAGRVADLLAMEISTLSRNAHIMENEGWITIERAERGNGRILRLTPAGVLKLREARPAWDRAQTKARELLGDQGAQELKRLGDGVWDDQLSRV
jgi:DNA-binding MarR family transcriptional regulator